MIRSRFAAALAVAAAMAIVGLPATAHADEVPVVTSAHSDYDLNMGVLLVSITSPSDVTDVRAHIRDYDTREEVAVQEHFYLQSGTKRDGVWRSNAINLDKLGYYRVDVNVTDEAGHDITQTDAGYLDYSVVTFFENVTLNRTAVTYENRVVTVRGWLKGRWPGSGEVRSLGRFPMSVNSDWSGTQTTTRVDGSFTGTATISYADERVWAEYAYSNDHRFYGSSRSGETAVAINKRPMRVTIAVDRPKILKDETVTISGQLTWRTPEGWVPVPQAPMGVFLCTNPDYCGSGVGSVTTDADGRYSLTVSPYETGRLQIGYSMTDEFVGTATASTAVTVLQPAAFRSFSAVRENATTVTLSGEMEFNGGISPGTVPLKVQFSATGEDGTWGTPATIYAGGSYDFATSTHKKTAGYWRVHYPGTSTMFQSATSPAIYVG
ncbi:hypothetical protein ACPB67_02295 [Micromonospora taraxaci]|uniref:hypothetical protein n=1 Tax=Micromonospora taraxaci TaxID=1316803 RepID=UPI003C2D086B